MADLRKLIASMDHLNESTTKLQATVKPVIAEGSMLKALNMVTKSVAPAAELAKEFKLFKEGFWDDAVAHGAKKQKEWAAQRAAGIEPKKNPTCTLVTKI
jgi:hypothetical protein